MVQTEEQSAQPKALIRQSIVSLDTLTKVYSTPAGELKAVNEITLEVNPGEFIAIVGPSGSGKTTLINLLTGIDRPTSGNLSVNQSKLELLDQRELSAWRGRNVGVIFQFFQLMPTLTILENTILPMELCGVHPPRRRRDVALQLLEKVGIPDQADKFPAYLSGGQQQRAAIARALANDPPLLCADEPTGNLDSHSSHRILDLFQSLTVEGKTVLMVTHERDLSSHVNRELVLNDGKLVDDRRVAQ